jgi:hypothetical protein
VQRCECRGRAQREGVLMTSSLSGGGARVVLRRWWWWRKREVDVVVRELQ